MATGVESGPGGGLDYNITPSGVLLTAATAIPYVGQLIEAGEIVYDLVSFFEGIFSGVPHDAKTLGAGEQLVKSPDPIVAFLGGQLINAAHAGRVISESMPYGSLEERGSLVNAGLFTLANRYPIGPYVAQSGTDSSGDQIWQFGPVPPPSGAPYSESVTLWGQALSTPLSPSDYQTQHGFAVPTQQQFVDFINAGQALGWQAVPDGNVPISTLATQTRNATFQAYNNWLQANVPTPPVQPAPPGGFTPGQNDEILDCCQSTAKLLTQIDRDLNRLAQSPTGTSIDQCCQNIVTALSAIGEAITAIGAAIPTAPTPGAPTPAPIDLTGVVAALDRLKPIDPVTCAQATGLATQLVAALEKRGAIDLTPITEQLTQIAKATSTLATQGDTPQAIINQLIADGLIDPQYSGLLQGAPADWVRDIVNALAHSRFYQRWKQAEVTAAKSDPAFGATFKRVVTGTGASPTVLDGSKATGFGDVITGVLSSLFDGAFDTSQTLFGPIIAAMLKAHSDTISGLVNVQPGQEGPAANKLLTEAMTLGAAAHFAAVSAETLYPLKNLGMPQMAALLAELAGFAEIMRGIIGPEVTQAIAIPHRYAVNATARAILPNLQQAMVAYSRRKIDAGSFQTLIKFNGLSSAWEPMLTAISYRPLQPRALATAIQDTAFPVNEVRGFLEDNALTPQDVEQYLSILEYNSLRNVRNSYITETLTAYGQGVVADDELTQILDQVGWSPEAQNLAKGRALMQRRVLLAKKVETEITAMVASGQIAPDVGEQQLEAAGVQPWLANLVITLATTKASVTALKREQAAERKLETQRQRNNTKTAVSQYQAGTIDEAGLTAALVALGLDATLVASIVAVQVAARAGKMRILYGKLLKPEDYKVLQDRVGAIETQLKQTLITVDLARSQLQALGLDSKQLDALLAKWAAAISATATAPVLLSPITGQPVSTTGT